MKANLPQNEPRMLAHWQEIKLYAQIRQTREVGPVYVLHDGPPYANGPIHLGTAMNKCLKDFVVKSKIRVGYNAPKKLASQVAVKTGLAASQEVARFPGRKLEFATFAHPFLPDRKIIGVLAQYVTMDQGTGAVHTAPRCVAENWGRTTDPEGGAVMARS